MYVVGHNFYSVNMNEVFRSYVRNDGDKPFCHIRAQNFSPVFSAPYNMIMTAKRRVVVCSD